MEPAPGQKQAGLKSRLSLIKSSSSTAAYRSPRYYSCVNAVAGRDNMSWPIVSRASRPGYRQAIFAATLFFGIYNIQTKRGNASISARQ